MPRIRKLPRVQQLPAALRVPATAALCRPSDDSLAAVLTDGTVVLWDLRNGQQARTVTVAPFQAACVGALVYGQTLVVGAADRAAVSVHTWQATGEARILDAGSEAPGGVLSVAGRGDVVAALTADAVLVWSMIRDELVAVLTAPVPLQSLGFTPSGHLVALGPDGAVAWNGEDFTGPVPLVVPPSGPHWPLLADDASWIAIAGSTGEMRVLTGDEFLQSGRPSVHMMAHREGRLGVRHGGRDVVVHPAFVAVSPTLFDDDDPFPTAFVGQLAHQDVVAVVVGPDGLLVFATPHGQLTVVEMAQEKWLRRLPDPPRVAPVVPAPGTYPAHRIIDSDISLDPAVCWKLIETSRRAAAREFDDLNSQADRQAVLLEELLVERTPKDIAAFDTFFQDRFQESYRTELWAVAEIVGGGCSDDGFEYFRCWLIGQGEKYYRRALADPQRAADRVREAGDLPQGWDLALAADQAYERVTGQPRPPLDRHMTSPELTGPPYDDPEDLFPRLNRRLWGE